MMTYAPHRFIFLVMKIAIILIVFIALLPTLATAKKKPDPALPPKVSIIEQNMPLTAVNLTATIPEPPASLTPPQWIGKTFIVLDRPTQFRKDGYGLFLSPLLNKRTGKPDPADEESNFRVRYIKLAKKTLVAQDVKIRGVEYLVCFLCENDSTRYYALTHKLAVEGLALVADLQAARARWLGKKVYARKRFINSMDSSGKLLSVKVACTQPLTVTDVRLGVTPLPPDPVWIVVAADSIQGFIPTAISWTNAMKDKIALGQPWDDAIFENDPHTIYKWDTAIWEIINNHSIGIGLTRDQVRMSWGEPRKISVIDPATRKESWTYDAQVLIFVNDELIEVK